MIPPTRVAVTGGDVLLPDGTFAPLDVICDDGRITAALDHADPSIDRIDASGCIVAPGFIDLQINGGFGHDFTTDPTSIAVVARLLPRFGVTAFLPTIVTSSRSARHAALDAISDPPVGTSGAVPLGLHLEGPAISPHRVGAHRADLVGLPAADETSTWSRGNGVAMVTLAPETVGVGLVAGLTERGIVVSAGHTECTAEQFAAARSAGLVYVTHLFNAMAPFSHRSPGPIGATLADDSVVAGLICDRIHVDPTAIKMAWNALGPHRTNLVTDAMAALGADAPTTMLGDTEVRIGADGVRTSDGVLAGSNLSLDLAVRNLVATTGCNIGHALLTVTRTPTDLLGLDDRGRVEVGARADLVVLDHRLHPVRTLIGGRTAWKS